MHLEAVSESVVALAQATLRAEGQAGWTSRRTWLRKLLNSMALEDQYEHYEKAGLTVPELAGKEAEDLCAWGNEHNTNYKYTVGVCQSLIDRAIKCRATAARSSAAAAAIAAAETSGALLPVLPKRQ